LTDLENDMMASKIPFDKQKLQELRDELNGLKDDYITLVGGTDDLPLCFGKIPDSLQ